MGMCVEGTPLRYHASLDLYVKHEEMSCPGGPNFSKSRGVYAHIQKRPERVIGVLDTSHSQGGWAVARACRILGKTCVVYYPQFKQDRGWSPSQVNAKELGAAIVPLNAGRSAILYHRAKKHLAALGENSSYMMPNALKLDETVEETALEFERTRLPSHLNTIIVSASSGTIAAGVLRGAYQAGWNGEIIVHLGYSRSEAAVRRYLAAMSGVAPMQCTVVDEGYAYADRAKHQELPFPADPYYDLKAVDWWIREGRNILRRPVLLWLIG